MWASNGNDCNGLSFLRRSSEFITLEIMDDPEYDIFSMQPELQAILDEDFGNEVIEFQVPEILPTSPAKKLELEWLAGRLAFMFKNNKSLSDSFTEENSTKYKSKSLFLTKSMKDSIILKPSDTWMQDLIKMDGLFSTYHGENSLRTGRGLISKFHKILKDIFPTYDVHILKAFTFLRTGIQIKCINKAVEEKKKSKMTQRGAKKTVRMAGIL